MRHPELNGLCIDNRHKLPEFIWSSSSLAKSCWCSKFSAGICAKFFCIIYWCQSINIPLDFYEKYIHTHTDACDTCVVCTRSTQAELITHLFWRCSIEFSGCHSFMVLFSSIQSKNPAIKQTEWKLRRKW